MKTMTKQPDEQGRERVLDKGDNLRKIGGRISGNFGVWTGKGQSIHAIGNKTRDNPYAMATKQPTEVGFWNATRCVKQVIAQT
jgi:hypothetical protein